MRNDKGKTPLVVVKAEGLTDAVITLKLLARQVEVARSLEAAEAEAVAIAK
jgi:hypothetical protein